MSQSTQVNRRIVLASRPHGPRPGITSASSRFRFRARRGRCCCAPSTCRSIPTAGRMSDAPSLRRRWNSARSAVGGTVSRVEASNHPGFKVGDWVLSANGWQD